MKTEFDYGYSFAEVMQGDEGFDRPVAFTQMVGGSIDIPTDDYLAMLEAGIKNPNAREYWRGFNSFFA